MYPGVLRYSLLPVLLGYSAYGSFSASISSHSQQHVGNVNCFQEYQGHLQSQKVAVDHATKAESQLVS